MDRPLKALYVMFEGLPPSVIDSQVLQHVRDMRQKGVEFEIWTFAHNNALLRQAHERHALCEDMAQAQIRIFKSVRPGLPFSEIMNGRKIAHLLDGGSFDIIHARTDYSAAAVACMNPRHPYIWDNRGDSLAQYIYESGSGVAARIKNAYKTWQCTRWLRLAGKHAAAANFVSLHLRDMCRDYYGGPSTVIGCVADDRTFFFDGAVRAVTRDKLGYTDRDIVICYAGSAKSYQCLPQSIALFDALRDADSNMKLLLSSPDREEVSAMAARARHRGDIQVIQSPYSDMNAVLNAADAGLLLREDNPVNRVASPTKFAEYALTGLPVIMTAGIGDLDRFRQDMPWHIAVNLNRLTEDCGDIARAVTHNADRARQAQASAAVFGRRSAEDQFRALYALSTATP